MRDLGMMSGLDSYTSWAVVGRFWWRRHWELAGAVHEEAENLGRAGLR